MAGGDTAGKKVKVVVVCGPTASGKTALGIFLARRYGAEIVSADSRQIYIGMDVGTAKPTARERRDVPHHGVDVVFPHQAFNAFMFLDLARRAVQDIRERGKHIIVVGGTGLYLRAMAFGLAEGGPYPEIREMLRKKCDAEGPRVLHEWLASVDPESASAISPNDAVRNVRALEVYLGTGKPASAGRAKHRFAESPYEMLWIGVAMQRAALYERINARVDEMISGGLVEEVAGLMAKGYGAGLPSMKTLGYREVGSYLSGAATLDQAREEIKTNTRRYAKRQMTWFRARPEIRWHDAGDWEGIAEAVGNFL